VAGSPRRRLHEDDGVTDEAIHALCARLPALTWLDLGEVESLMADGLRAVGGLTALTFHSEGSTGASSGSVVSRGAAVASQRIARGIE